MRLPALSLQDVDPSADADSWHALLRDPDGIVQAYGASVGDERWLDVPGAGLFRFFLEGNEVDAFPIDSASDERVFDAYYGTVLPLVLQARGFEALHASGVETSSGVSAFCAISGVGKSTLTEALSRRGHFFWADDVVVLEPRPNAGMLCHWLPPAPGLQLSPRDEQKGDRRSRLAPLAAVSLLERTVADGPIVTIRRLPLSEAIVRLLEHAHSFEPSDEKRRRATSENYLKLVGEVPVFEVIFRPGARYFDAVIEEVERTVLTAP